MHEPHNADGMLKHLPAGLTQFALNNYTPKSPPCHVAKDGVSVPFECLVVENITSYHLVRDFGGAIAVLYKTQIFIEPSWEREADLQQFRFCRAVLLYRAGTPNQQIHINRYYRYIRVSGELRKLARVIIQCASSPGCDCVGYEQRPFSV